MDLYPNGHAPWSWTPPSPVESNSDDQDKVEVEEVGKETEKLESWDLESSEDSKSLPAYFSSNHSSSNNDDEDDHQHLKSSSFQQSQCLSSSSSSGSNDLRLQLVPTINLATEVNLLLTPIVDVVGPLFGKKGTIFAGRDQLSSTFHVVVPSRPTTIAHVAGYLEMKLYDGKQGRPSRELEENLFPSHWTWPIAIFAVTPETDPEPVYQLRPHWETMDDLRREAYGPHLAYDSTYHFLKLYYTHARDIPQEKTETKKSQKMKLKTKKAKENTNLMQALAPFTGGPSTSSAPY